MDANVLAGVLRDLAIALAGIVGTVVGSIVTLLIERWIRARGSVQGAVRKILWFPHQPSTSAGTIRGDIWANAQQLRLGCAIDFHNGRDEPVGLRAPKFVFMKGRKVLTAQAAILRHDPDLSAALTWPLPAPIINLAPSEWVSHSFEAEMSGEELSRAKACTSLHFAATDADGKDHTFLLSAVKNGEIEAQV